MGKLLLILAQPGVRDGAIERGIGANVRRLDAAIIVEGQVVLFFLCVQLRQVAEHFEIVGLGLQAAFVFGDQARGRVFGLDLPVLLFERYRFLLVFEDVAIRAGARR